MRKLLSVTIVFLFMLILSTPHPISGAQKSKTSPKTSYGRGKAHFSETTWDFGRIPANSTVSHVFWIKNVGTDTLKISGVRPG